MKRAQIITFTLLILIFAGLTPLVAKSQEYKTLADTTKLNKRYAELALDVAKLNIRLEEERSKAADYQSKAASASRASANSGQDSKDQAAEAASGNTRDTRKAVKEAKRANRRAHDAKDADADVRNNEKKIKSLSDEIDKKNQQLLELDKQRQAIINAGV